MPFDEGFNFRATSGYVTDPADTQFVTDSDSYDTTANGVTFGFEAALSGSRNRSSGIDARLAGIVFVSSGTEVGFRVDLPSTGDYEISLALGDAGSSQGGLYCELQDDTTTFATIDHDGETTSAGNFYDATDTLLTAANWPGSNTPVTRTFTSTIFRLKLGKSGNTGTNALAHVRVTEVAGGGGPFSELLGIASETDSALSINAVKSAPLGIATEVDTAFAIASSRAKALGIATEADVAIALQIVKSAALGTVSETDTTFSMGHSRARLLGLATETDTALPFVGGAVAAILKMTKLHLGMRIGL